MSEANTAAQVDPLDAFVQEAIDQVSEQEPVENQTTESAPVEDTKKPEATEATEPKGDEPKANGVQERINKITADKHEERRQREASDKRADELQAKLDSIEANKPTLSKPNLEDDDINFDEDLFNKRSVAFQVQEQVKAELTTQKAQQDQTDQQAEAQAELSKFNERAEALGKDDFAVKAKAIPELPEGVASAIMSLENGAEMVYHLGSNLDKADALSSMTPMAAMMELGRISASISVKPEIKTSAAPDPIEPVTAGSALSDKIDDEMSIDSWMAKYN